MRFAAYFMAVLFVMIVIAIVTWLAIGFSSGGIFISGSQMVFVWSHDVAVDDLVLHDGYYIVTTPVPLFVVMIVGMLPLAILGIVTVILFGRIPKQREL